MRVIEVEPDGIPEGTPVCDLCGVPHRYGIGAWEEVEAEHPGETTTISLTALNALRTAASWLIDGYPANEAVADDVCRALDATDLEAAGWALPR